MVTTRSQAKNLRREEATQVSAARHTEITQMRWGMKMLQWQRERARVLAASREHDECPTCHTQNMRYSSWDEILYDCETCGCKHVLWRIPWTMQVEGKYYFDISTIME